VIYVTQPKKFVMLQSLIVPTFDVV